MKSISTRAFPLSLFLIAAALLFTASFTALPTGQTAPVPPQTERVFFGNLHSHTSYSDGSGTPEEAYEHARDDADANLDFMALTEHNHAEALGPDNRGIATDPSLYKGSNSTSLISTARRLTRDGQFVALYGQEFSTISSGNHVNVFDVGEVIAVQKGRFDLLLDFLATNRDSTGQPAIIMMTTRRIRSTWMLRSTGVMTSEASMIGSGGWALKPGSYR